MNKKSLFLIVALILSMSMGFNVYGASKVIITWWPSTVTPEKNAVYERIVKEFEKQNPDIHVDYLGIPGEQSMHWQKWSAAFAAGNPPDVTGSFNPEMIQLGALEPLDKYWDKWPDKKVMNRNIIEAVRKCDPVNHRLYGMPFGALVWSMWVRSDVFKAAKLEPPKTWDDFFKAVPKLTDKSKGFYGLSIRGGGGGQTLEMLMYSYSGITNYFTKDGKSTINDPKHVEFIEKYLGLYGVYTPEDDLTKGWTQLAATFQGQKTAMIFHNLGSALANMKAFNNDYSKCAMMPFPKSLGGYVVHPGIIPKAWAMAKGSKYKEEAWRFITFLVNHENNSACAQEGGNIPCNLQAAKDDWVQKEPSGKTAAELMADKNTRFTDNPYYLPGYMNIAAKMEPEIQKVMMKRKTAKELLDNWAQMLEKEKASFDATMKK